jgi:hypothetical protein
VLTQLGFASYAGDDFYSFGFGTSGTQGGASAAKRHRQLNRLRGKYRWLANEELSREIG